MKLVVGVTVLTLGILSVAPGIRATESSKVDTTGNVMGEPAAPGERVVLSLPVTTTQTLCLGAVAEASAEVSDDEELAKELANPIASLISVPFEAIEDSVYGPARDVS